MKVTYIELLGQKHPMCFSLGASEQLDELFGGLENMDAELHSGNVARVARATNTVLEVLLKAGRIYVSATGEDLPPPLPCRPADLIDVTDKTYGSAIHNTISGDSAREVETVSKNAEATQDA